MTPERLRRTPEKSCVRLEHQVDAGRYTTNDMTRTAPLAQSAERLHGKEKVYGSIP